MKRLKTKVLFLGVFLFTLFIFRRLTASTKSQRRPIDVDLSPLTIISRFRFAERIRDRTAQSGASLCANPALVNNGGKVTVSWTGIVRQEPRDWVGLFCPSGADARAYIEFCFTSSSVKQIESSCVARAHSRGCGSVEFTLFNLRSDCEFRYYGNGTHVELVAVSNKVKFIGGREAPLQGHLALTANPTQMRVSWTSGSSNTPFVQYGLHPEMLQFSAKGTSQTYAASDMCGPPANITGYFIDPGYLHDVLLTGLHPNTPYYYKFGSKGIFSWVKKFETAIPRGDPTAFQFIVYGDMGDMHSPGAVSTARSVLQGVQKGAAFVMHVGDLSYATGRALRWEAWMALIEPYATLVPYMICIGNHEYCHMEGGSKDPSHAPGEGFHPKWGDYANDSRGECGVPVFHRFRMPDMGFGLWWYSYDYGLVHFTVISTEHDFTPGSPQYQWIESDLKSVDRTTTPWVIVAGHRPMYTSEVGYGNQIHLWMQKFLEEMFHRHRVDLAVWGHYHSYERTCAVYKQKCDLTGTVHIVIGSGGYYVDDIVYHQPAPWSLQVQLKYGYLQVSVANCSALFLEFVGSSENEVKDQVWIYR